MFNIKLEEKSYKISFKALPVKIQRSKKRQEGTLCPVADRVKEFLRSKWGLASANLQIFMSCKKRRDDLNKY